MQYTTTQNEKPPCTAPSALPDRIRHAILQKTLAIAYQIMFDSLPHVQYSITYSIFIAPAILGSLQRVSSPRYNHKFHQLLSFINNAAMVKSTHDYYEVLGVPQNADSVAIRARYRFLAREKHPDHNKSTRATEDFQLVRISRSDNCDFDSPNT